MTSQPRIITGTAKGTRLKVPASARPITDRIKMSVFDIISDYIEGSRVIDMHAGSGTMGLEALSRGATSATFVDKSEQSCKIIRQNITSCRFNPDSCQVINSSINQILSKLDQFDILFADPPFPDVHKFQLQNIHPLLNRTGIAVIRLPVEFKTPEIPNLQTLHSQEYGSSRVDFLALRSEGSDLDQED